MRPRRAAQQCGGSWTRTSLSRPALDTPKALHTPIKVPCAAQQRSMRDAHRLPRAASGSRGRSPVPCSAETPAEDPGATAPAPRTPPSAPGCGGPPAGVAWPNPHGWLSASVPCSRSFPSLRRPSGHAPESFGHHQPRRASRRGHQPPWLRRLARSERQRAAGRRVGRRPPASPVATTTAHDPRAPDRCCEGHRRASGLLDTPVGYRHRPP